MAANEEELLRRFQASASPQTLRDLLVVHQDRVYNACFQVLGRAEDAEDAAQEALLKLAEGARSARDADAFRGWIYRVSFRVALDHWRRREATRNRELRSAMNRPATPPLDDRERVALFEAMDGLDDRERALLLEHYFEKVPLADLGERRGVSAVAIWKRIDRAREKLKKTLLGAGLVVATSRVSEALEASIPVTAPATLLGETILGNVLAGGLAVGMTKSLILAGAGALALLLLGLALGAGTLWKPAEPRPRIADPAAAPGEPAPLAGPAASEATPAPETVRSPGLLETLQRYKAWMARSKETSVVDHRRQARKEFKGARALILSDPATFLEYLRDPANGEVADSLAGDLLLQIEERDGRLVLVRHPYGSFPPALMEGLAALLKEGPAPQKRDIMFFLVGVDELPEEVNLAAADLLRHADGEVQYWAAAILGRPGPPLNADIESRLKERCIFRGEPDMKHFVLQALSRSENSETRKWMLDCLEGNREPNLLAPLAEVAVTLVMKGTRDEGAVDRAAALLTGALKSDLPEADAVRLLSAAMRLPPTQSTRILQTAQYKLQAPKLIGAIAVVLDRISRGDSPSEKLQAAFAEALK